MFGSLLNVLFIPTTLQTISTTYTTPIPTPFPPIPRNSKCARKSRVLSADQNCSGGVNIGELLRNRSAQLDTARISQLHSHFCSSQKCFNQYVKTYSACQVHLRGADGNATAEKVVSSFAQFLSPYVSMLTSLCTSYNPLRGPYSNGNTEPKLSKCNLPTYIPKKWTITVADTKEQVNNNFILHARGAVTVGDYHLIPSCAQKEGN